MLPYHNKLIVLECCLIRYSQLLATLCATRCQHLAAIGGSHSLTETVLVDSLAARRLISSFHCHSRIVFIVLSVIFSIFGAMCLINHHIYHYLCGVQRYNLFLDLQVFAQKYFHFSALAPNF